MFGHHTIIICIHGVLQKKNLWTTAAPLLCFQIVEYYHPERVMRQFGLLQKCLKWPTDNLDKSVHYVKMIGKSGINWLDKHAQYYRLWNMRAEHVVGDDNFDLGVDYTTWYHQHSHLFTTPEAAAHMYQVIILAFSIILH